MLSETTAATLAVLSLTASFPFYVYGALVILNSETVTWAVLTRHLRFIAAGLLLSTVPVVTWMLPRLVEQFQGVVVVHAVVGLHAYALLAFALTGIARIFQVKHRADLYRNPDPDVDLDDLHENMSAWRARLRVGVFGYLLLWLVAYATGVYRYVVRYVL